MPSKKPTWLAPPAAAGSLISHQPNPVHPLIHPYPSSELELIYFAICQAARRINQAGLGHSSMPAMGSSEVHLDPSLSTRP